MKPITAAVLRAIAPRFSGAPAKRQSQIIEAIAGDFTSILNEYEINTPLRVAHFLAQIIHESAGLQTTQEFASGAAYEGRRDLGNTVAGDGKRYKGRGVLQLTGRANYRRYGQILGLDLEGQPQLAAEPLISLRIACVYWRDRNINPLCDADDLKGVTRKVNGGTNGLTDRGRYLAKAKAVLAAVEAAPAPAAPVALGGFAIPAADGPAGYDPDQVPKLPMKEKAKAVYSSPTNWSVFGVVAMIVGWVQWLAQTVWGFVKDVIPDSLGDVTSQIKEMSSPIQDVAEWFSISWSEIQIAVIALLLCIILFRNYGNKTEIAKNALEKQGETEKGTA